MLCSVALLDRQQNIITNESHVLPIYSIAKTFIASAIRASDINTNSRVDTWIEPRWLPDAGNISVAHLLHHKAGLSDYTTLPAYHTAIEQKQTPWSDEQYAAQTLHLPRKDAPGERFAYSNPGYWLLKTILEIEHNQAWSDVVEKLILQPLTLTETRVQTGLFADDLPHYPSQWVWHGVMMSTALDIAKFMASDLVRGLETNAVVVEVNQPPWVNPHYGYGVMIEPGVMYGHNGGGPGYTASAFNFLESGNTGCVLLASDEPEGAMKRLLEMQP